jgi:hypothetical protein
MMGILVNFETFLLDNESVHSFQEREFNDFLSITSISQEIASTFSSSENCAN